jgi:hypothetical protein
MGRTSSGTLAYVGVAFAVVGIAGWALFGWEFEGSGTVPTAIGALAALVAVGATLYRELAE